MVTKPQKIGDIGESLVRKKFNCLRCKKNDTLQPLIRNFKCADVIFDFCGYLAQVATTSVDDINIFPESIMGPAWKPLKERMDAGIFTPIFFVLIDKKSLPRTKFSVFYLPADLQNELMFVKRKPLKKTAKRPGWQGYMLNGKEIKRYATR